ncbi:hypothetical protein GUJ93_ZPchr0014g47674 [Zizania palustris]|uniref:RecQ-mediated genome instability protein 1 n=1 Tax=Zizania palustris TaxID=103762 RepID=A0A8J5T7H2_ZIZPA|nr:hypothetical protein GUJ93_ZPchr0014g47674 [Zizania palustris]
MDSVSGGPATPQNPRPVPVQFPFLSSPPPSPPIEISDDDEIEDPDGDSPFVDAPDDLSPPLPSPPAPTPTAAPPPPPAPVHAASLPARNPASPTPTPIPPLTARTPTPAPFPAGAPASSPVLLPIRPSALSGPLQPVDEFLRGLGLRLRPEWLESCAAGVPGFYGLGAVEAQARRCFEQFLFADMNTCGAGVLPEAVGSMHSAVLDGPFVLQVDEIVNLSAPLRERYRDAHAGLKRCLKLSITDGIQHIYGMEYRPIKDLEVLAPAGFKIVIRNVHIRRGLLMLVPEVIEILGGVVDELEEARDRLVSEVNKPPRGKRKQGGLPLSSRATLAAWPTNINATNDGEQGTSMPRTVNAPHPTRLDAPMAPTQANAVSRPRSDAWSWTRGESSGTSQSLQQRGITSSETMDHGYELRSQGPASRGLDALDNLVSRSRASSPRRFPSPPPDVALPFPASSSTMSCATAMGDQDLKTTMDSLIAAVQALQATTEANLRG